MNKLLFILWVFFNPLFWYSIIRPQHAPADKSNRMWKLILVWFAFTRYEDLIKLNEWFVRPEQWRIVLSVTFNEEFWVEDMPFLQSDLWEYLIEGKRG